MKYHTILFTLFLCFPFFMNGQDSAPQTEDLTIEPITPYMKNSQFGIMLELNNSQSVINTVDFQSLAYPDRINSVTAQDGLGIGIGMLFGYSLNDIMTIRTQAMLSFLETSYAYDLSEEDNKTLTRETVNLELPLHFVFENVNKAIAPSAVLGARYRHNISKNTLTSKLAGNYSTNDVLLDAGLGLSFQFDNFRFKTELLYSKGLFNQVGENDFASLNNAIDSSLSNQLSLRFMFYM